MAPATASRMEAPYQTDVEATVEQTVASYNNPSWETAKQTTPASRLSRVLQTLTPEQLSNGIILAEILGKPVSLRKSHSGRR